LRAEVTIVVPCFNEEAGLPALLTRLDQLINTEARGWEALFVDDGSVDRTQELLAAAARDRTWLRVVRHPRNLGLGAALRSGFAGPLAPVVCTIDSDCTYPPERLPEMLDALDRGADIVTASPWHPENRSVEGSRLRVAMSRTVSRIYQCVVGNKIHTFTCLFRAYRREVVERVSFADDGFSAVAEILVRAALLGYRVVELPMPLTLRRHGVSNMSVVTAITSHLKLLTKTARWVRAHRRSTRAVPR
jgi:dolichol-phosphate mannosyltransferase